MGGTLKSPLFDLEQYSQRMKVSPGQGRRGAGSGGTGRGEGQITV
jgi:hypothetical protein